MNRRAHATESWETADGGATGDVKDGLFFVLKAMGSLTASSPAGSSLSLHPFLVFLTSPPLGTDLENDQ